MHTLSYTTRFRLDYRRAKRRGLDPARLRRAAELLAAGEPLPPGWHDAPLEGTRPTDLVRSCRPAPGWLLTYRLAAGRVWLVRLEALAPRAATVSPALWMKTLLRSPVKMGLTVILIAAASFLFLYNLLDYAITKRQYENTYAQYQGYINVDLAETPKEFFPTAPPYFYLSDAEGNPAYTGAYPYEDYHQRSLTDAEIEGIASLPYISAVSRRVMGAGVAEYERLPTNFAGVTSTFFIPQDRLVLEATMDMADVPLDRYAAAMERGDSFRYELKLRDVKVLAGDEELLKQARSYIDYKKLLLRCEVTPPGEDDGTVQSNGYLNTAMAETGNRLTPEQLAAVSPGERCIVVCRVSRVPVNSLGIQEDTAWDHNYYSYFTFLGDDSLYGWWPYITSLEGQPENYLETAEFAPLRELIALTERDRYTLDVVYTDEMRAIRRYQEGKLLLTEGRLLKAEDTEKTRPVCLVSAAYAERWGLRVGDSLTLELGDRCFEPYAALGAVASSRERNAENWRRQRFEIVGLYADSGLGSIESKELYWAFGENAVFVPRSFLPETAEPAAPKPAELSFIVQNAGNIAAFEAESLPLLRELGYTVHYSDGGWMSIADQLEEAGNLATGKLIAFGISAVLALYLTVYLFIVRKKKEYAVMRALGCPASQARGALLLPLSLLAIPAVALGTAAALISTEKTAALNLNEFTSLGLEIDTSIPPEVVLAGCLGSLALLLLMAFCSLGLIARRPPLALLQEGLPPRAAEAVLQEEELCTNFGLLGDLPEPRPRPRQALRHTLRWVRRHVRRTPLKAVLSLALALILCFAMGFFTVLRASYAELVEEIEVKARFIGGFGMERALAVARSGYVSDPYYELTERNAESFFQQDTLCLSSDLSRACPSPVTMLEGYEAETLLDNRSEMICVASRGLLERLGLGLGDKIEVTRKGLLGTLMENNHFHVPMKSQEELEKDYHQICTKLTVVGIAEDEGETIYASVYLWKVFSSLFQAARLDLAEFTLNDYHEAAAFRRYAMQQLDTTDQIWQPRFSMDTSEADRAYRTYRLLDMLYPIAFAVAILLGGVLPGIVILQSAKEAALLRVLGTTKRRTRAMLGLEQVFLCVFGLALAVAALLAVNGAQLRAVAGLLAVYLAAHFAFCVSASGAAAVNVTKRGVLELLQVKE